MTASKAPLTPTPKTRTLTIGAVAGLLFGLMAAYLYSRAAEEEVSRSGSAPKASTGELITISLAVLGLARQIAEMGRSNKKR